MDEPLNWFRGCIFDIKRMLIPTFRNDLHGSSRTLRDSVECELEKYDERIGKAKNR